MNLSDINKSVVSGHEEKLSLPPPKEDKSKVKKEKEKLKTNDIGDFYSTSKTSEMKKEVSYYKQGGTSYSSSSYGSRSSSSSSSKVGLYGGANLNYNDRINRLRKKSKEIAKESGSSKGERIPFEGSCNFSLKKGRVKVKTKTKKTSKHSEIGKQIGIAVATICLEVSLGILISSSKVAVEKIANEVKNFLTRKEVINA